MTRPVVGNVAEELYQALTPLAYDDERQGWALLLFAAACAFSLEEPDAWSAETDDLPGWGVLMDVDQAPLKALPWLAQFVGVTTLDGYTDEAQRLRVRETDGFNRGSLAAIQGAARQHLTGTQNATVRERYDSTGAIVGDAPYHMQVTTYQAETPDPTLVAAALQAQKPAGIILTYDTLAGQDLQTLYDNHPTLDDVAAAYVTLQDIANDTP